MILTHKKHTKLIDYPFWIALILFSNPGGIQEALNIFEIYQNINLNDFLFVFLMLCYFFSPKQYKQLHDYVYKKSVRFFIFFVFYYIVIFGILTPAYNNTEYNSTLFVLIKMRYLIYSVGIFIFSYHFFNRSAHLFIKTFLTSSVAILSVFLISLIIGTEILPYVKFSRGFVEIDRNYLHSYGLMPFLIPLGIVFLIFYNRNKTKYWAIIGFALMFITWVVSLTRRHILGTFIFLSLSLILKQIADKKKIFPLSSVLKTLFYLVVVIFILNLTFPKYINAGIATFRETIHVIKFGESSSGQKDERLGFSKKFIVDIYKKHPSFGTGFDNRWRSEGDELGYESSDYPFLSALAMSGIIGILVFLPIYLIIIRTLLYDFNYIRKNPIPYNLYYTPIFIGFFIIQIYDIIQYFNWFLPISNPHRYDWFVQLAFYFAARKLFYNEISSINNQVVHTI